MDLKTVKDAVINSPLLRYALVLVTGIAIGAIFYPTKHLEESLRIEYEQKMTQLDESHKAFESTLNESLTRVSNEKKSLELETTKTIAKLTTENSTLKSKKSVNWYKIVHPDGTIEERRQSETQVDQTNQVITSVKEEFTQKVKEIETRYEVIHAQRVTAIKETFDRKEATYKETIAKLSQDKVVDINPKKYGVEIGYLSNKDYYGHVNIDVVGPIFLGLQTQTNFSDNNAVGAGFGIRF